MWVSIILAVLSFLLSKSSGASNAKALTTAALVGAGSYYVATETDWGKANLTALDGPSSTETTPVLDSDGKPVVGSNGALQTVVGGGYDVLKSWGGLGTAAVVGTAAAAGSGLLSNPWVLGGIAVAAFLILNK